VDQFRENLGCLDVQLTGDHVQRLSALSQPRLGFPHEFLAGDGVRRAIYGETFNVIDLYNRPNCPWAMLENNSVGQVGIILDRE
jgi:hypothetical protein